MIIIVMGVSGSGKSTLGGALARQLGWDFLEGDDYHPYRNIQKMRAQQPLDDDDRRPWLTRLHQLLASFEGQGRSAVLACSALKQEYRDLLSHGLAGVRLVYLGGNVELIRERLRGRESHFMPAGLLDSQLATLEPPEGAVVVPVDLPTPEQVKLVREELAL